MTILQNINASMQFTTPVDVAWDDVSEIVPAGMWVYDTEEDIIRVGTGTALIDDCPIFCNLKLIRDVVSFLALFPNKTGKEMKVLAVNEDATGYTLDTISVEQFISMTELTSRLDNISNIIHNHNDLYYTKDEVDSKISSTSSFSTSDADILSFLVLNYLEDTSENLQGLPNGFADEFETNEGIDTTNSNGSLVVAAAKYVLTKDKVYTSSNHVVDESPETIRSFIRANLNVDTNPNRIIMEMSRDNGANYRLVDLYTSKLNCGDMFTFMSGDCDFTKRLVGTMGLDLSQVQLENLIGNITQFSVDTTNTSGHFNVPANIKVGAGCKIYLSALEDTFAYPTDLGYVTEVSESTIDLGLLSDTTITDIVDLGDLTTQDLPYITITGITNFGTAENSVTFIGNIPQGNYTVSKICGLEYHINTSLTQYPLSTTNVTTINGCSLNRIGNFLYLFGGMISGMGSVDELWRFDITAGTWLLLSPSGSKPVSRYYHASCVYDGKLYIHGGSRNISPYSRNDLWVYDPSTNSWTQLASGGSVRYGHFMVNIGDYIYMGMGNKNDQYDVVMLNDLYRYDPATNTWTTLNASNKPPAGFDYNYTTYNNKIYISGGRTSTKLHKVTYSYDPSTNTWTQLAGNIDTHRRGHFQYNGVWYTKIDNAVIGYDFESNEWITILENSDLAFGNLNAALPVYNDKVYITAPKDTSNTSYIQLSGSETKLKLLDNVDTTHTVLLPINNTINRIYSLFSDDSEDVYVSFRKDDAFYSYVRNEWKMIVRRESGIWQYIDSNNTWQVSPINTSNYAISQAISSTEYKSKLATLSTVSSMGFTQLALTFNRDVTITELEELSMIAYQTDAAPIGTNIKTRITNLDDSTLDIHGVRIRW